MVTREPTSSGAGTATRRPAEARISLGKLLVTHPIQQFKRDPRFYLRYDAFYLALFGGLSALMLATHFRPVFAGVAWRPWHFAAGFPAVLYLLINCHLWVHNACHGSFPRRLNRLVGELCGIVIFVRYASWEIVHMRHHEFSDDRAKDPHPNYPSYFRSFFSSIVSVERQLQDNYCEVWGDTPENRRYEAFRAKVSYGANIVLTLAWYLFLGPVAFLAFWLPGNLLAAMFVGHFNWSTHNGAAGKDFRPVNLDAGYFWVGNRIFTGIYYHANHHTRPHLFNPRHWDAVRFGPAVPPVDVSPPKATA